MAEVAHVLHVPLSELKAMDYEELCDWHIEVVRIVKSQSMEEDIEEEPEIEEDG